MAKPAPEPAEDAGVRPFALFRAGQSLFSEGEPGACLYIIEEGTVELCAGPAQRRLGLLEAGDVLGELSLLDGSPREVTARAVSDVKALRLDRAQLDALLAANPDVAALLLRRVSRRLRDARLSSAAAQVQAAAQAGTAAQPVAAAPAPQAKLIHETTGREFTLPRDARVVVGRPSKGHTPDVDLSPLDTDRSLSRRHAELWSEGGRYFVCEQNEVANGTFLNGRRLSPGEPAPLADGDRVAFGLVKTIFHLG